VYQFRVKVPVDLRKAFGREHVNRSLRTDSRSLAVRLSRKVAAEVDAMFEAKRLEIGLAVEGRLLPSASVPATVEKTIERRSEKASAQTMGLTLSQVYDRYLADPTKRRSARTMLAHQTTRRVVEDVLGADTPIANITRDQCRDLLETLRWLPVNMAKKFGDAGVREAAKAARADLTIRTINSTNLNAYMARFATMMNWAVTEELIGRNPARGLQVADTIHPQDRRKPFEPWQLQRIFNAPIYTGCKDEENGYSVVGSHIAVGARFWVPLICLFSGMRLNEACQLDVTDVREIEGILCFVISEKSLVGTRDKSLKTKSSERIVPAHPELLAIGLAAFVERKRRKDAVKLFDDLPIGKRGFRSVAFSRWFTRFLVSIDAASARTCFHSFRHGFRDATRNAQIDRDVALRLGGWITGGSHSETADDYGSGYRPQVLFEAISCIQFPEVSLSHLKRLR
jgi:integrase